MIHKVSEGVYDPQTDEWKWTGARSRALNTSRVLGIAPVAFGQGDSRKRQIWIGGNALKDHAEATEGTLKNPCKRTKGYEVE